MPQQSEVITRTTSSLADVVERILDKGIVIDAWINVSVIGIELITIEARVIVASVETYSKYARLLGEIGPVARGLGERNRPKSLGENVKELGEGVTQALPLDLGQKAESRSRETVRSGAGKSGNKRKSSAKKRR